MELRWAYIGMFILHFRMTTTPVWEKQCKKFAIYKKDCTGNLKFHKKDNKVSM